MDELANITTTRDGKEEMVRCEEIFRQICWLEERFWPDVDGMGEEDETAQLGPQVGLGNGLDNRTYNGPMNQNMNGPMNNNGMNGLPNNSGMNMSGSMNGNHVNGNMGNAPMNGGMSNSRMNGNDDTSASDSTSTFQMGTLAQSS